MRGIIIRAGRSAVKLLRILSSPYRSLRPAAAIGLMRLSLALFSILVIAGQTASPAWARRDREDWWDCIDKARQTVKLTGVPKNALEALVTIACDTRYEPLPAEGGDIAARVIEEVRSYQRDRAQTVVAPARPAQGRPFW
jgi:hypothetical protein